MILLILMRYIINAYLFCGALFLLEALFLNKIIVAEQFKIEYFKEAIKYSDGKIWDKAEEFAEKSNSNLTIDLVNWLRLRSGEAIFSDYLDFIENKHKWPGMPYLTKQAENSITENTDTNIILNFFKNDFPITGHGSLMLALANLKVGNIEKARKISVISWLDQKFNQKDFELMVKNFEYFLSPNHKKRLNNLLWKQDLDSI